MRNARDTPELKEPPSSNQWGSSLAITLALARAAALTLAISCDAAPI